MINVFIDTSIFVSEGFVKGKSIATLFEAAREEKIRILMPDITEHEVRKHLYVEVKKSNSEKAVEKLKKSYMYAVTEFRSYIEKLMDVTAEALAISVEKELDRQFNKAAIERLALSEDLDFLSIVEDYKALNPPFSEKKNKEFPDAIVLKQLEGWCKKHDDKCVLLSTDPDLKKYKSDNLEYRELSDFVASLEEFEKMISQDKLKAVFEASRERLEEGIKAWINEQYEDDSLFINYLLIEDIYGSYINRGCREMLNFS